MGLGIGDEGEEEEEGCMGLERRGWRWGFVVLDLEYTEVLP